MLEDEHTPSASLFCVFCAFSRLIDELRDNAGRMEKEGSELAAKKRRKHKRKGDSTKDIMELRRLENANALNSAKLQRPGTVAVRPRKRLWCAFKSKQLPQTLVALPGGRAHPGGADTPFVALCPRSS